MMGSVAGQWDSSFYPVAADGTVRAGNLSYYFPKNGLLDKFILTIDICE
jgi:hypothetical protein